MADLADVVASLSSLCDAAIYPTGDAGASITGKPARILRGWPVNASLNADLAASPAVTNVSIFPMQGMTQNVSQFRPSWLLNAPATPTLTATIAGGTATISGTSSTSQVVGLVSGGIGYAYRPTLSDTPATIAAAFASKIIGATSTGPVVTLVSPQVFSIAEIYADTTATAEVGRQKDGIQVSVWAPDDATRGAVSNAIKSSLDGQTDTLGRFTYAIAMPDGSQAHIKYARSYVFDTGQVAGCYRRDLIYTVEYPTIITKTFPPMLFGQVNVLAAGGTVVSFGVLQPINNLLIDQSGNIVTTAAGFLLTTQ